MSRDRWRFTVLVGLAVLLSAGSSAFASTFRATPAQCSNLPELDRRLKAIESCQKANPKVRTTFVKSCMSWWTGWPGECMLPPACRSQADQYYALLTGPMGIRNRSAVFSGTGRANAINSQIRAGCATKPGPSQDIVHLNGMTGKTKAIVLLDGQRTGKCVSDETLRGNPDVEAGNVIGGASCNTELVVMSQDNAMTMLPKMTAWTAKTGDEVKVSMAPAIRVPLTVWVLQKPFKTTKADVEKHVARASQLFRSMDAGLQIGPVSINDVTGNKAAAALLKAGCDKTPEFKKIGYTARRLNVYYVAEPAA